MPYVGGSLVSLFDEQPQAETALAARRMAAVGAEHMRHMARTNTPVETGRLRESWQTMRVSKTHVGSWPAYKSGILTAVKYAPFVEYGTGIYGPSHRPYVIVPKRAPFLAWRDPATGRWVRAKKVIHPGSPGNHMVAIAAHMVEAATEAGLMDDALDMWARSVEASAD